MNERIKKLYNQCFVVLENESSNTGFDIEKFAELIIRQCAYHADVFAAIGCPEDMDPTEATPGDYIKKQLGVE